MNHYYNKWDEERWQAEADYKLCKNAKNIEDIFNLPFKVMIRINGEKVYNDCSKKYGTEEIKQKLKSKLKNVEFEYVGDYTNRKQFNFKLKENNNGK